MTTVRELIQSSLRLITVLGAGENMTAEDGNDALKTLNQMLESWAADGTIINSKSLDTKALSSGVNSYTMGVGGDINTSRPAVITFATITQGTTDYPLNVWSYDVYATVENKNFQGLPTDLYVNNGSSLLTLVLDPVPYAGLTLSIYSEKPLSTLALNDVISLPPGYERALRFNLAVEIAPEYEREASQTVMFKADESLRAIKRNNQQYAEAVSGVDYALSPSFNNEGPGAYNIFRGY